MTPPTRYALVPERMTPEMHMALLSEVLSTDGDGHWTHPDAGYEAALAASPNAGCVTAEMLLNISIAFQKERKRGHAILPAMKIALEEGGLQVADAPAGEAEKHGND